MLPNLDLLEKKCRDLNLKVSLAGKKPQKDDYVRSLRAHFMPEGGLPYEEVTPMLCYPSWNLKPIELEGIWASERWIAQEKLNGCRIVLHFVPGKGVFAHSRSISVKTYRYSELTDVLLFREFKDIPGYTVVDAEIQIEKPVDTRPYSAKGVVTKTALASTTAVLALAPENSRKLQVEQNAPFRVKVFDIMRSPKWGQEWGDLRNMKLENRLIILEDFKKWIQSTSIGSNFMFPGYTATNKKLYNEAIWVGGGEGTVLKNLDSTYEDSSSRSREGWVKVKKRKEVDAYVVGFERGDAGKGWENLVGDLLFAVLTKSGQEHVIAKCSNMKFEKRQAITIYDSETNEVTLHPDMYRQVAQVSGQDVSSRSLRLTHATIDRWRDQPGDEKSADECVVDMNEISQMAEWVC